ncbi:unnamed protein product [Pieris macdunnoughi]|uniref:Protein kinase domain-containing protein n=1 Tax=Pieris macdunnoughi TaxID=345717 RepID=A0A821T8E3_9NEOP|nr:unnamed protein product [Pieris macdunnoughi]
MDPGSPSTLWPLRLSKPAITVPVPENGENSKAEDRAQSPALTDRLSASPSSPSPPSPAPPQHQFQAALVAEKYLLLEQVEGSSLCRCVDVRTQEEYVCKVVYRDCSGLLQAHDRLDGHPHVNPIHEVLVGDKRVYLIFPRSHSDLHSYVRARKRLREHEARRLFRQMAETVAACHEQGIVLRDLKLRKFVFADPQSGQDYLNVLCHRENGLKEVQHDQVPALSHVLYKVTPDYKFLSSGGAEFSRDLLSKVNKNINIDSERFKAL